jgi:hypothetical protein
MFQHPTRSVFAAFLIGALAACKSGGGGEDPSTPVQPPQPDPISGFHFEVEAPSQVRVVDPRMAGVNYLHTRDRVQGTFATRAEALGVTYLRWPGGAMAEDEIPYHDAYFTNGHQRDWQSFTHDADWSLKNVSEYAVAQGMEVMVVLPTKKYVLSPGVIDEAAIRQEIGPFVHELTRGRFGPVPDLLEIGNEFYWGNDKLEAEDYTGVARIILEEIRSNQANHIDVALQAGRLGQGMIGRVASSFSTAEKEQIDFIADHIYTRNFDWNNFNDRFRMYRNNWGDKPALISEWNVKSTKDGDPSIYAWGIEQAAPMVRVWDAMVRENTKAATFWALQQNTMTSAFPNEGEDQNTQAYVGGETFAWLAQTVGMTRQDVVQRGEDGMGAFAYREGNRVIAFIAGLDAGQQQVKVNFPGETVVSATGRRMSGIRDLRKQTPELRDPTPAISGGQVQITINNHSDQELVRLDIQLAP